mgnify:CR=1 FL=1
MHSLQLSWPQEAISQALSPFWPEFVVEAVPQLDSTNTALLERARSGHTMPVLLVTEKQTAGRGRMGRQWHNTQPAGGMLAFSLGLPLPACDLSGLSLVVACSVVNSLDAQQRRGLRIKWPNDLWLDSSKLGGILVEICSQGAQRYAVIGVGRRFFNAECGIILGASRNLGGKSSLGARLRTRKVTAQGRFAACDQGCHA